jgi:broad specificity phosphatase PhoE
MYPILIAAMRHGRTPWNDEFDAAKASGDWSGLEPDESRYDLSSTGSAQAICANRYFEANKLNFDLYFTSDLPRAMRTASKIANETARWFVTEELREQNFGYFDLSKVATGEVEMNEHNQRLMDLQQPVRPDIGHRPLGGESETDMKLRVNDLVQSLKYDFPNKRVILLSSENTLWTLRRRLFRWPEFEYRRFRAMKERQIDNCGIDFYSRENPVTREIHDTLAFYRYVNPVLHEQSTDWQPIRRPTYNSDDLVNICTELQRKNK